MEKRDLLFGVFLLGLILAISLFVVAKPNFTPAVSKGGAVVIVPAHAIEIAPGIFSLGTAKDVDGKVVEGFMVFHHRAGHNGGPPGGGGGGDSGGSTCFAHLAKGAKWKSLESWMVNPSNTEGLDSSFVFSNLGADIQKWEDASSTDILGDGSTTGDTLVADTISPDGKNEVYFGDVSSSGAIAVTIVWGIFRGKPSQRELVEWDQVYDQVDFDWSSSGEAGKMDFENIAQHELGHSVGMGHPDSTCTEETMYAFASSGETKKRTLEAGDIAGVNNLYSA